MSIIQNRTGIVPPAPHVREALDVVLNFYKQLPDLLPDRHLVLDAGCGEGRHACYLASLGFRVIGIDTDSEMIREAMRRTPQTYLDEGIVRYDQEDIDMLRFREGTLFGGVVCNETLQLLPLAKRQATMKKLMNITASGGFHLVSAYVGSLDSGTGARPLSPGSLRRPYDESGWDVIHFKEDPYEELEFGAKVAVSSIASIVAIKP